MDNRDDKLKAAQAEHAALAKAYYELSLSQHGQMVLDDLKRLFMRSTVKRDGEGRVDPYGTLSAASEQNVYFYITDMVSKGSNRPGALKEVSHG